MKHPAMERREFLKKAGLTTMALTAAQGLSHSLASPVLAHGGDRTGYIFAALNIGDPENTHRLYMTGEGNFTRNSVQGGGSYIHFDVNTPGFPLENSMDLLETGTWRAERLIRWAMADSPRIPYGQIISGILDLTVRLFPVGGPRQGVGATMAVL